MTGIITWASAAVIILIFLLFGWEEVKLYRIKEAIKKLLGNDNVLESIKETKIAELGEKYIETINIETENGKKTNIPASEYFNDFSVCKCNKLNLRMLDTGSGTLVGLGLLGTFLGLTLGISNFDSSDTARINESIQGLLAGMGTAFLTSLLGMGASIVFTFIDKALRHRLYKHVYALTEQLDSLYYIDDVELSSINQQKIVTQLYNALKTDMLQQTSALVDKLTYHNADGQDVSVGNAIREILTENQEQSKALKSFSTDLAIELNNGFDEVLSRQMQQKILPLMENVDATTKAIVEHIDQMAAQVSSPATDMMQKVVDELKQSMQSVINEFSTGLSGSATTELENLAHQLGTATQAMAEFPKNMQNISATLQVTIDEVKNAISEISNTSANANSTAMQQMQEQISFATGAISTAIAEVKDVMSGISQSSQEQSNQMISKLADAAEKMGTFLSGTISTLSSSVQQSVKSITDDVNSKQADLIALQEDTTSQTKKLLETFNTGLDRLEKMNEYITSTMNMFQQAQGQITGSTAHLQTITGDMKLATQLFNKSQSDYAVKMEEMQHNSQRGIDAVTELLKNSGELSGDYVEKFETIRQGLGSIFQQLQSGLTEYSRTVQASTQKYLEQYSTSLTDTTDALSSTIQQQNEVVEMLVESLNAKKK